MQWVNLTHYPYMSEMEKKNLIHSITHHHQSLCIVGMLAFMLIHVPRWLDAHKNVICTFLIVALISVAYNWWLPTCHVSCTTKLVHVGDEAPLSPQIYNGTLNGVTCLNRERFQCGLYTNRTEPLCYFQEEGVPFIGMRHSHCWTLQHTMLSKEQQKLKWRNWNVLMEGYALTLWCKKKSVLLCV